MADRRTLLGKLVVGDIFHAQAPNGASYICLVLAVSDVTIRARRVTTQENVEFDRKTGIERDDNGHAPAIIDSVTPLPPEVHNVFVEMDRRNRRLLEMDDDSRFADLDRLKLTDAEKKALLFIASHYSTNLLPPPLAGANVTERNPR